MDGFVE